MYVGVSLKSRCFSAVGYAHFNRDDIIIFKNISYTVRYVDLTFVKDIY